MKQLSVVALLIAVPLFWSATAASAETGDGPIVTHEVKGDFEGVSTNVKFAISNQGLVISGTSHLQEMLDRTAADLGYEGGKYVKALSYEFCSADLAHKMFLSDRRNVATCPMTIAVYVLPESSDTVVLAYRKPILAVPDEPLEKEIMELFETIIEETTAW